MTTRSLRSVATALLAVSGAFAQTWTTCNPLNVTCPGDTALGTTYTQNFTSTIVSDKIWNTTAGTVTPKLDGAEFTINGEGEAPTIQSMFYIFFGRVSTIMKASPGTGIVSSVVMQSDDLDEIDWEFIGGNSTYGQTNFFGKGNTTVYDRAVWHPINDYQAFHNYTTVWTAEKIDWYIDSNLVRSLNYNDSLALNGKNYPQTPMFIKLGSWAGGSSTSKGTVEWAGGAVDWSQAPFTMTLQNLEIADYSTGSEYTYGDKSGSWQSIQIKEGNSTIADSLKTSPTLQARFDALSKPAKIGIAIGAIGAVAILMALFAMCCVKKRRAGRRERVKADAEYEYYLTETNRQQDEIRKVARMQFAEKEMNPRTRDF